jgi:hypothetical protein
MRQQGRERAADSERWTNRSENAVSRPWAAWGRREWEAVGDSTRWARGLHGIIFFLRLTDEPLKLKLLTWQM